MTEEIVEQAIAYLKDKVKHKKRADLKSLKQLLFLEMSQLDVEELRVILLDMAMTLIDIVTISRGTVNKNKFYPREIVKHAILNNAVHMILVHNHPSNNSTPSSEDIGVTKELSRLLVDLEIKIFDHWIVSKNRITSFKEQRLTW
jgi:DNA repair protein RadC